MTDIQGSIERSINIMKTINESGDTEAKFERIIEECKKNNKKYSDPDFYPQKKLIDEDKRFFTTEKWLRIEDYYPHLFEDISPSSIQQGSLSNCYFVCSLIYTAHDEQKVKYLFHPKSSLEYGCVLIYFHFLGQRFPVIVDTQINFMNDEEDGSLIPSFACPKTKEDSCWFVLVEKAFAKACGGYHHISGGDITFACRLLFDYFPVIRYSAEEIIQNSIMKTNNGNIDIYQEIFKLFSNLKKKNAMFGASISLKLLKDYSPEEIEQTGLVLEHAYQIIDFREVQKKRFYKLRNPWGEQEWIGPYSRHSKELTSKLKKELNISDSDQDGSFWMIDQDFFCLFNGFSYSLPSEKDWKVQNVYGKIEGYLDNRNPCNGFPSAGCLPQWSIKFTKKALVRISYDYSGPEKVHGIYFYRNKGLKIYSIFLKGDDGAGFSISSYVNGIEYEVNDFSEPYTLIFCRNEKDSRPCYYRIKIESSDTNFEIKKFNDNFISEKWNSVSYQGIFTSSKNDQWDPLSEYPLTTCRQWYLRFPQVNKNEKIELRVQLFKNKNDGEFQFLWAKTDQPIKYPTKDLECFLTQVSSQIEYDEYMIVLDNKDNPSDVNQWNFCVFMYDQKHVCQFKYIIWCRSKFEFGLMPEPDPSKNCGYSISGKLKPGENDGAKPNKNGVKNLEQWCLVFKKSPTKIFIDYSNQNAKSNHFIFIASSNAPGEKLDKLFKGTIYTYFPISSKWKRDRKIREIEDISKSYALCVTRDPTNSVSDWSINIFGDNEFEMNKIDGNKLGKSAQKYEYINEKSKIKKMNFKQISEIVQPNDFKPKKAQNQQQANKNAVKQQKANSNAANQQKANKSAINQQQKNKSDVNQQKANNNDVIQQQANKSAVNQQQANKSAVNQQQANNNDVIQQQANKSAVNQQQANNNDVIQQKANNNNAIQQQENDNDVNQNISNDQNQVVDNNENDSKENNDSNQNIETERNADNIESNSESKSCLLI